MSTTAQVVVAVVSAIITGGAAAVAAYFGGRTAIKAAQTTAAGAENAEEWQSVRSMVEMACSQDKRQQQIGMSMLESTRQDWNKNQALRKYVMNACRAVNEPVLARYAEGDVIVSGEGT